MSHNQFNQFRQSLLKSENSLLYIFILLLEGYLTLSIEILTIRQLIPFVGNSIIATSLVIGVFLLALAFGYQKGGTYRSNFKQVLVANFTLAFFVFGIGLSYIFIAFLFELFRDTLGWSQYLVLITYLTLITAPLIYLLGQTVPLIMGLLHNKSHTAAISGFVLNINTIGSFLGSVLTSIVLLNYLGVAGTILFNLMIFVVLILLFSKLDFFKSKIFVGLCVSLFCMYVLNLNFENNYFIKTNTYANYKIKTVPEPSVGGNKKYLIINNSLSSLITSDGKYGKYVHFIRSILFEKLDLKNKKIVVLGAGGFTISADGTHGNEFTYVDIDKNIKEIVTKSNYTSKVNGKFVGQDARDYINKFTNTFDVVISDAYTNRHSIPFHLLTKEYFASIKKALNQNGIAIVNLIGSPYFKDKYTKSVHNTISAVFANCTVTPLEHNEYANIIYICYKQKNNNRVIYSDNLNTSALDIANN